MALLGLAPGLAHIQATHLSESSLLGTRHTSHVQPLAANFARLSFLNPTMIKSYLLLLSR
jgi:hypothetical protein